MSDDAFDRGMEGSALAARRWTPAQKVRVKRAVAAVARRRFPNGESIPFTSDDIWEELGPEFPVTKGLASILNQARRAGFIRVYGYNAIAQRGGQHDHAQRLNVWILDRDPRVTP